MSTMTAIRPSERASKYMRDALLFPDQTQDVVLTPRVTFTLGKEAQHLVHAHADFGHGDFGHADFGHADA